MTEVKGVHKSIRVLRLPASIIAKIEKQKIRQIFDLIRTKPQALKLTESESKIFESIISQYKYKELSSELESGAGGFPYAYLDEKHKLAGLGLSRRAVNALGRHSINAVSRLLRYIEEIKIYNIAGLGARSIAEIMEKAGEIVQKEGLTEKIPVFQNLHIYDDLTVEQMGYSPGLIKSLRGFGLYNFGLIRRSYLSGILGAYFNHKTLTAVIGVFAKYFAERPKNDFFYLKAELVENHHGRIKFADIPALAQRAGAVFDLEDFKRKVSGRDDLIAEGEYLRLPFLTEKIAAAGLKPEAEKIIMARFGGETLQAIADKFGKTRERIRQIVRDRMRQFAFYYEEGFVGEYNKFRWHPEVFKKLFALNDFSYNVVKYLGKRHPFRKNYVFPEDYVRELMDKGAVSPFVIERFKAELPEAFKPRIRVYGKSVEKMTKRGFFEYVIKRHIPASGAHKTEIVRTANKIAADNNLDYHYDKYIDIVTNAIHGFKNVRYYDYRRLKPEHLKELGQILDAIDSVYSCNYFFRSRGELMRKIDVRDGYELHYLLRRLFSKDERYAGRIDFRRQPMIAPRGESFAGVIVQKWRSLDGPVPLERFAGELIKDYGYHPGTLINVINDTLGDYISRRVLYDKEPSLSPETLEIIKTVMSDNFYELDELAAILEERGVGKERYQYFSNRWLRGLGYKTHDINYIIKEEFASLKDVFFTRVLSADEYQLTDKDYRMRDTTLILFIETLRSEYRAFLVKDKLINIRCLEKRGVTETDIRDYVKALTGYLREGEYFTYESLLNDKYYLSDPALEKIERMNLERELIINFIRNVPGIKKATKGNLFRIADKLTTLTGFINYVAKRHNPKSKAELKDIILNHYGLEIRKNI